MQIDEPVHLEAYNESWKELYRSERERLAEVFQTFVSLQESLVHHPFYLNCWLRVD
ncbi:GrpB family protein [Paenibacillus lactis]|uniref:GrpB family protein n=1 Tax=Paenibacillus lactis TaxID=228574 RepID=UPI00119FA332